jgi:predicted helicase
MNVGGYLDEIRKLSESGQATEHSYRPALERLFQSIDSDLTVINEPKRLTDVGAPDFVFNRNGVSVGWCEAKDLTKEITKFKTGDYSKEQKARYAKGLPNLIYTNGTDFEFIVKGEVTGFVSIADLIPTLPARQAEFPRLEMLLKDFASQTPISINTAKQLAEMMAGKAVIIKDIMGKALVADKEAGISTELTDQYEGFKISLIHDITIADFADIYAETIAYGLFAARLHDSSLDSFNRAEALELLPKSNPFLRNLFVYIAGPNLDDRLRRMIDDLCDVFRACDVGALMQDFGKFTARNDPFLHFYETFLAEYNPAKRKARGVWYTPEPVVNFIVRAVDDVLKTEFSLPLGLADTSKISIDWDSGQNDAKGKPVMIKKDVHRVQILDPATGTGTFLAETIKQIAAQVKGVAEGMWSSYVERDLIPRLHGFELLMASYAMCHMKLDMMLTDMGYKPSANPPRLGVYLTNSLEEGERVEQTLPFARWLSEESKGANTIKRDTPIMCVIGNPPYSGISQNMGSWIVDKIEDYKYVGGAHFGERKHWLHDDYVKFIRMAEHMIDKNGEGILGFITNHGYLDNPTFRGMRHHLLQTFDKIFILDLHGNSKKKEVSPDGSADKNVFDIQQGVAIIIAIKKTPSPKSRSRGVKNTIPFGSVFHSELWGAREAKYDQLWELGRQSAGWTQIKPELPHLMFCPRDYSLVEAYGKGFRIDEAMPMNVSGIVSARDDFVIDENVEALTSRVIEFGSSDISDGEFQSKYALAENYQWKCAQQRALFPGFDAALIKPILYRQFDRRKIYYQDNLVFRTRKNVMQHMYADENIALLSPKITADDYAPFVSRDMIANKTASRYDQSYIFPLYEYPNEGTLETERRVNFDAKIYTEIRDRAGLKAKAANGEHPDEIAVFDYIYGVLHSPDYRQTFAQFLKIDFPRIPYPASPQVFAHVSEKGGYLRRLHLMEEAAIGATPYPFNGDSDNVVEKPFLSDDGVIMINPHQGFHDVPTHTWEFNIGGYQPAQKWLKDRKGRSLSFDDVRHYQRIIKVLAETDRIMKEIKLPIV